MKSFGIIFVFLAFLCGSVQAQLKFSAYPNATTLSSNLLFLLADPGVTNRNIALGQLRTNLINFQTNAVAYAEDGTFRVPWWVSGGAGRFLLLDPSGDQIIEIRKDASPNGVIYIGSPLAGFDIQAVSIQMEGPLESNPDPRATIHFGEDWGYSFNTNRITGSYGGTFGNISLFSNDTSGGTYYGDVLTPTKLQGTSVRMANNIPFQFADAGGTHRNAFRLDTSDDLQVGGTGIGGIIFGNNLNGSSGTITAAGNLGVSGHLTAGSINGSGITNVWYCETIRGQALPTANFVSGHNFVAPDGAASTVTAQNQRIQFIGYGGYLSNLICGRTNAPGAGTNVGCQIWTNTMAIGASAIPQLVASALNCTNLGAFATASTNSGTKSCAVPENHQTLFTISIVPNANQEANMPWFWSVQYWRTNR
jgi:hypothetical protein